MSDELAAILAQVAFIAAVMLLGFLFYRFDKALIRWLKRRAARRHAA